MGPLDMMRLTSTARQVEAGRIAALVLESWAAIDPQARESLRLLGVLSGDSESPFIRWALA